MFEVIDRAYLTIQNLLNAAFPFLEPMVWAWFGTMCAWTMFLSAIEWLGGQSPVARVGAMFVRLGVFVYFASVWKTVIDGLGNMALQIGLKISGASADAERIMSPSGIFKLGNDEAARIIDAKNALCDASWTSCIGSLGDQLLMELLVIGIWICFAIVSLSLIMAGLTFKKHGLFAFMFLPFSQLKATSFLTESAISGVIQCAVWLAFIAMVAGFGSIIFGFMRIPEDPDMADILPAFLVYLFIGVMGWQSRTLAQGVVTGTTRLGGEALTAAARNTLGWATGTAALGRSIAMASEGPVRSLANAAGAAAHVGRVAHARATGAPMPPPRQALAPPTSGSSPMRGGRWDMEPTDRQRAAARSRGVDMDPSWYRE